MKRVASIALSFFLAISMVGSLSSCSQKTTGTFEAGKGTFLLNGDSMVLKSTIRVSPSPIGSNASSRARHWV